MSMTEEKGGSFLTSTMLIYIYYFLGLLGLFVGGIPLLISFVGGIVSRIAARREGSPLIVAHCSWIVRSTWVSVVLGIVAVLGGIALLGMSGVELDAIPDSISSIQEFMDNPALRQTTVYVLGIIACASLVGVWFLYRMIRGAYKLSRALPPA